MAGGMTRDIELGRDMIWTVWALLLLAHGAYSRWVETASRHAALSVPGDLLLITVALITIDQLQGSRLWDFARAGAFFVAFGFAGRQLMGNLIRLRRA